MRRREDWLQRPLVTHWLPRLGPRPDVTACGLSISHVTDFVREVWTHVTCQRCLRARAKREARA
jgi:hypothetical protein